MNERRLLTAHAEAALGRFIELARDEWIARVCTRELDREAIAYLDLVRRLILAQSDSL